MYQFRLTTIKFQILRILLTVLGLHCLLWELRILSTLKKKISALQDWDLD